MNSTRTPIDSDRTLAELVEESPELARVFESFDLDYCCGGDRTLEESCEEEGLDESVLRDRLREVRQASRDEGTGWETMTELIDHIISEHHEAMREELPALGQLVQKVRRVHGENHPELAAVEREFSVLAEEMQEHTDEEETEVFPVIKRLDQRQSLTADEAATLRSALADLEDDHDQTAAHLEAIAAATDGYSVPDDACASYRNMLDRLEAVERDTHLHVHKENNLLFPRVERAMPVD